jgi:hypothetical protein
LYGSLGVVRVAKSSLDGRNTYLGNRRKIAFRILVRKLESIHLENDEGNGRVI